MVDIFLSYTHHDQPFAERLVRQFEAEGWSVFWDRSVSPGETWRSHIERPLEAAKAVVVLWSERSVKSQWVEAEADRAMQRGVYLPARIDDVRMPLGLAQHQAADLIAWARDPGMALPALLLDAVRNRCGAASRPMSMSALPSPFAASAPRPRGLPLERRILVGAGAVAAVGGAAYLLSKNNESKVARPSTLPAGLVKPRTHWLVFFDPDSDGLNSAARGVITEAAIAFRGRRVERILVTGHDETANDHPTALLLSLKRANAVKDVLVAHGVPADKIVTAGRGKDMILVQTADHIREPQNRRVEIVFE